MEGALADATAQFAAGEPTELAEKLTALGEQSSALERRLRRAEASSTDELAALAEEVREVQGVQAQMVRELAPRLRHFTACNVSFANALGAELHQLDHQLVEVNRAVGTGLQQRVAAAHTAYSTLQRSLLNVDSALSVLRRTRELGRQLLRAQDLVTAEMDVQAAELLVHVVLFALRRSAFGRARLAWCQDAEVRALLTDFPTLEQSATICEVRASLQRLEVACAQRGMWQLRRAVRESLDDLAAALEASGRACVAVTQRDNGSCELSLWGGCPSATWRALLLIGLDARVAEHVGGAVAKFCVAVTEHPGAALRRAVDERAPCPAAAVSARNGSPAASGALVVFSLEAPKGHSTAVGFHSPLLVRRRELQTTDFVAAVATTLNKLLDICAAVARSVPGGGDDGTSLQTALLSAVGLRLWPPLCHAVVENVLKVFLPESVSDLSRRSELAACVEAFEQRATLLGVVPDTSRGVLSNWLVELDSHFAAVQRSAVLEQTRELLASSTFEVWNEDGNVPNDPTRWPVGVAGEQPWDANQATALERELTAAAGDATPVIGEGWPSPALPPDRLHVLMTIRFLRAHPGQISVTAFRFALLLHRVLSDACSPTTSSLCGVSLLSTCRDAVYLLLASVPALWGRSLTTVPHLAVLFHNDCRFLANQLQALAALYLPAARSRLGAESLLVDLVSPVRKLGQQYFVAQLVAQREAVNELLDEVELDLFAERSEGAKRSLRQLLHTINRLHNVWQAALPPSALLRLVGALVELVCRRLCARVQHEPELPEASATRAFVLLGLVEADAALAAFVASARASSHSEGFSGTGSAASVVDAWDKILTVRGLLAPDQSIGNIEALFAAGRLAAVTLEELRSLLCALFEDSPRRQQCLLVFEAARVAREQAAAARAALPDFAH